MKQRFAKLVAFALFASFTSSALAAINTAGVPSRSYSKILTLNVESDMSLETALGTQSLTVSDFTGGGYDKLVKTGTGVLTMDVDISSFTGDIYVENGVLAVSDANGLGNASTASFVVVENGATLRWTQKVYYSEKLIYYAGDGYSGQGGVLVSDSFDSNSYYFCKNLTFVMTGNASVKVDDSTNASALLGQASLYMNGFTNTCYFGAGGKSFHFCPYVKDAGVFSIKNGMVRLTSVLKLPADGTGTSRIILDGCKVNFYSETYPSVAWPIYIAKKPGSFAVQNSASAWPGALEIAAGKTVDYNQSGNTLTFEGGLKGGGTLTVKGGTLALGAANDDFTGTLKATGGSVKLPTQELGVRSGLVAGYSSDSYPVGDVPIADWSGQLLSLPTLTNAIEVVEMSRMGNAGVQIEGQTTDKQVYTYSGYIMNTNETPETWAFLCNLKHRIDFRINNSESLFSNWNKGSEVKVARSTLWPGANRFVLKCYANANKGGRNTNNGTDGKNFPAFAVRRTGHEGIDDLTQTASTFWTQLTGDDGEGNIFRYATNSADVVALEEAGLLTRSTATFRNLELSSGVVFQMDGSSAVVSNLTGTGSIVQSAGSLDGNELVITGDWTIPAADSAVERTLASDVPVCFADGARIVLDYASVPHGRSVEVLTSDVGIVGDLPEVAFADGIARPAEVALSADGKTLSVNVKNNGLIIMWK